MLHITVITEEVFLRFFDKWSFLYNSGDAEHVGKATVCRAVRKKQFQHHSIIFHLSY